MDHGVSVHSYVAEESVASDASGIIEFYEAATTDYAHWSRGLNMHLGCYRRGMNPFDRESMLEQLNIEVAKRLELCREGSNLIVDIGCGMGAVARTVVRELPYSIIKGVTLAPSQVRIASEANVAAGLADRIEILRHDFTRLPFANASVDGAWAVESACYAAGPDKGDLLKEVARILKPGGRFVVVDCFVKHPEKKFNFLTDACYATLCRNWAVAEMPQLDRFVSAMRRHGFRDIKIDDISWNAAVSVAHAPFVIAAFILKNLYFGRRIGRHSIDNLVASLMTIPVGLSRTKFSYCIISGRRG